MKVKYLHFLNFYLKAFTEGRPCTPRAPQGAGEVEARDEGLHVLAAEERLLDRQRALDVRHLPPGLARAPVPRRAGLTSGGAP